MHKLIRLQESVKYYWLVKMMSASGENMHEKNCIVQYKKNSFLAIYTVILPSQK